MSNSIVEIRDVSFAYNGQAVLQDINLDILAAASHLEVGTGTRKMLVDMPVDQAVQIQSPCRTEDYNDNEYTQKYFLYHGLSPNLVAEPD